MSIRIGILGYGNLGRGVECAIKHNPDMELVAVFTRRAPNRGFCGKGCSCTAQRVRRGDKKYSI